MAPRPDPVVSDPALPKRSAVVVVGGGIVGASTAFFLARKDIPVVLCEKGEIGAEQSSRNWGWCRKMGRDPREIPLIIESLRLWGEMNALTGAETGFRSCGIVYLCKTAEEVAKREAWRAIAEPYQIESRVLTGAELRAVLPGLTGEWAGGLYTPSDGRGEPTKAAPAIAEAARRLGATVLTGCAVRGIETEGGRVAAAVTEKGTIACAAVVLAGGVWSRLFAGNLGLRLPQLRVVSAVLRTEPLEGGPEVSAAGVGFGFRKRLDGGYTVANWSNNRFDLTPDAFRFFRDYLPALKLGRDVLRVRLGHRFLEEWRTPRRFPLDRPTPFERVRVLDPAPDPVILEQAKKEASAAFPVFRDMRVAERWGGAIDVTPDTVPVLSAVDTIPGFFIATGCSGHGFGLGPGAGRLMADLVNGDPPIVDPAPFRFTRFSDGTPMRPVDI